MRVAPLGLLGYWATVPLHSLTAASGTVPPAVHSAVLHPLQYVDPARQRLLLPQLNAMTYARNTTVSAIRTRNEIEETLERYGADAFAYATQGNLATVIFAMENRRIRFVLELPDPQDFRYTNHNPPRERSTRAQQEAHDQACRQRWRALLLVIKAKLEAVTAGIQPSRPSSWPTSCCPTTPPPASGCSPRSTEPIAPARCRRCARRRAHRPPALRAHPAAARLNNPVRGDRGEIPAVGTGVPLCDNCPGGPVVARGQDGRLHHRPSAVEQPMVERRKPIVTELALADALDQLVNLIEELRVDVNLRVEITTDETELVKLTFSGTPDVGFPLQREVPRYPRPSGPPRLERGPPRLRDPVPLRRLRLTLDTPRHAHSEPAQYGVTPDQSRPARHHQSAPAQPHTLVGHARGASNLPGSVLNPPGFQQSPTMASRSPQSA